MNSSTQPVSNANSESILEPPKKPRKAYTKKKNNTNSETNPYANLNNIKSIKIPENFEEKEKLLQSLKNAISEIDLKIKNLKSKREYYSEIVEVINKEVKEKKENLLKAKNKDSRISVIQEELYNEQDLETEIIENNENIQENLKIDNNKEKNRNQMFKEFQMEKDKNFCNNEIDEAAIGIDMSRNNKKKIINSCKDDVMICEDSVKNDSTKDKNYQLQPSNDDLIHHNVGHKYNPNHEDFNNIEDLDFGHIDNYYMDNSLPLDVNTFTREQTHIQKINPENLSINPKSPVITHHKDINSLSDKFNLFAYKPKNKTSSDDNTFNLTHNSLINNLNKINNINCNIQPVSSDKKIITKEYFSKQINSIGNIQLDNQFAEIKELESKYGISLDTCGCPDYNSFSEEKLKEEMKKYGLKPASVKFMVKTLIQIWEFLNMKKLPDNLKGELSKFINVNNKPENNSNENSSNNLFNEYSSIGKSSIRHLNDIKKEKIITAIQEDQILWIKILRFKKIELKEIKEVLNKKGIIVENEILKTFLTELGVVINQDR